MTVAPLEASFYRPRMSKATLCTAIFGIALAWGCGPQPLSTQTYPSPRARTVRDCSRAKEQRMIDLTHPLHHEMPAWPGGVGFTETRLSDYDQGSRAHKYEIGDDVGTHVSAPRHFFEGKRSVEQIPLSELMVPVVVMNVRDKVKDNPDYEVGGNDVVDWEAIHGQVPIAAVFIVNTGWYERFNDPEKYANKDAEGVMHFPGFSKAAAQLLVERDVVGIGIDTLSVDRGVAQEAHAHQAMLGAGKYVIENLNNLGELPETKGTLIVGVLPVSEGARAPARVLALVPEEEPTDEDEEAP